MIDPSDSTYQQSTHQFAKRTTRQDERPERVNCYCNDHHSGRVFVWVVVIRLGNCFASLCIVCLSVAHSVYKVIESPLHSLPAIIRTIISVTPFTYAAAGEWRATGRDTKKCICSSKERKRVHYHPKYIGGGQTSSCLFLWPPSNSNSKVIVSEVLSLVVGRCWCDGRTGADGGGVVLWVVG